MGCGISLPEQHPGSSLRTCTVASHTLEPRSLDASPSWTQQVALPLGLDPETLTWETPEGPKGESGRAYNLGCCWICSWADYPPAAPTPTQTSAALVPTLSPACLVSIVSAAQQSCDLYHQSENLT